MLNKISGILIKITQVSCLKLFKIHRYLLDIVPKSRSLDGDVADMLPNEASPFCNYTLLTSNHAGPVNIRSTIERLHINIYWCLAFSRSS